VCNDKGDGKIDLGNGIKVEKCFGSLLSTQVQTDCTVILESRKTVSTNKKAGKAFTNFLLIVILVPVGTIILVALPLLWWFACGGKQRFS